MNTYKYESFTNNIKTIIRNIDNGLALYKEIRNKDEYNIYSIQYMKQLDENRGLILTVELNKETTVKTRYYITIAVEICRITNNQYIPLYCADYREVNTDISYDGLKYNIQDIYSYYIDEDE